VELDVRFAKPQRGVTPQQVVAFYDGLICLGSAVIRSPGPTYHDLGKPLPNAFSR
jgi:hypothetical protein